MKKIYRTKKEIIGCFAKWITRQYCYLDELEHLLIPCLREVDNLCQIWEDQKVGVLGINDPTDFVRSVISASPTIRSLNLTKIEREEGKGSTTGYAFLSRNSELKPENDFVDLDALERNIVGDLSH